MSVHLTQKTEIIGLPWRLCEFYFNITYRYKQRVCFSCPENSLNHKQQSGPLHTGWPSWMSWQCLGVFVCVCMCVCEWERESQGHTHTGRQRSVFFNEAVNVKTKLHSTDGTWIRNECRALVQWFWEEKTPALAGNPVQPHSDHHTSIGLGPNPGLCHKRSAAAVVFTIMTIIHE